MANLANLVMVNKMVNLVRTVKVKLTEIMIMMSSVRMIKLKLICPDYQKATT